MAYPCSRTLTLLINHFLALGNQETRKNHQPQLQSEVIVSATILVTGVWGLGPGVNVQCRKDE